MLNITTGEEDDTAIMYRESDLLIFLQQRKKPKLLWSCVPAVPVIEESFCNYLFFIELIILWFERN